MEDFHLLGFNIDLPQRTITYMQPSQPWKIRDSTTAGSQRLALSGLQSRLHTIRKYTFPPSSAEVAAAELVRLYVQKGHNRHACHRFLKKRRMRRPVCVHPWTKGFPPPLFPRLSTNYFNQAGGRCAVTLLHFSLLFFDAMVVDHDTLPSNRFLTAASSRRLSAALRRPSDRSSLQT